jgi:hypothetical protein
MGAKKASKPSLLAPANPACALPVLLLQCALAEGKAS